MMTAKVIFEGFCGILNGNQNWERNYFEVTSNANILYRADTSLEINDLSIEVLNIEEISISLYNDPSCPYCVIVKSDYDNSKVIFGFEDNQKCKNFFHALAKVSARNNIEEFFDDLNWPFDLVRIENTPTNTRNIRSYNRMLSSSLKCVVHLISAKSVSTDIYPPHMCYKDSVLEQTYHAAHLQFEKEINTNRNQSAAVCLSNAKQYEILMAFGMESIQDGDGNMLIGSKLAMECFCYVAKVSATEGYVTTNTNAGSDGISGINVEGSAENQDHNKEGGDYIYHTEQHLQDESDDTSSVYDPSKWILCKLRVFLHDDDSLQLQYAIVCSSSSDNMNSPPLDHSYLSNTRTVTHTHFVQVNCLVISQNVLFRQCCDPREIKEQPSLWDESVYQNAFQLISVNNILQQTISRFFVFPTVFYVHKLLELFSQTIAVHNIMAFLLETDHWTDSTDEVDQDSGEESNLVTSLQPTHKQFEIEVQESASRIGLKIADSGGSSHTEKDDINGGVGGVGGVGVGGKVRATIEIIFEEDNIREDNETIGVPNINENESIQDIIVGSGVPPLLRKRTSLFAQQLNHGNQLGDATFTPLEKSVECEKISPSKVLPPRKPPLRGEQLAQVVDHGSEENNCIIDIDIDIPNFNHPRSQILLASSDIENHISSDSDLSEDSVLDGANGNYIYVDDKDFNEASFDLKTEQSVNNKSAATNVAEVEQIILKTSLYDAMKTSLLPHVMEKVEFNITHVYQVLQNIVDVKLMSCSYDGTEGKLIDSERVNNCHNNIYNAPLKEVGSGIANYSSNEMSNSNSNTLAMDGMDLSRHKHMLVLIYCIQRPIDDCCSVLRNANNTIDYNIFVNTSNYVLHNKQDTISKVFTRNSTSDPNSVEPITLHINNKLENMNRKTNKLIKSFVANEKSSKGKRVMNPINGITVSSLEGAYGVAVRSSKYDEVKEENHILKGPNLFASPITISPRPLNSPHERVDNSAEEKEPISLVQDSADMNLDNFIQHLSLIYCNLSDDSATRLLDLLKKPNSNFLEVVNFCGNPSFGHGVIGAALGNMLIFNKCIIELNLQECELGNTGAIMISQSLHMNSALRKLWLGDNNIDMIACVSIADALTVNKTLQYLSLARNIIGSDGICAISIALLQNSSLIYLDINRQKWNGKIGKDGAMHLSAYLLSDRCQLRVLRLARNRIGIEGCRRISAAITRNISLKCLDMGYNKIGVDGAIQLACAVQQNSTLEVLIVGCRKLPVRYLKGDIGCTQHPSEIWTDTYMLNNEIYAPLDSRCINCDYVYETGPVSLLSIDLRVLIDQKNNFNNRHSKHAFLKHEDLLFIHTKDQNILKNANQTSDSCYSNSTANLSNSKNAKSKDRERFDYTCILRFEDSETAFLSHLLQTNSILQDLRLEVAHLKIQELRGRSMWYGNDDSLEQGAVRGIKTENYCEQLPSHLDLSYKHLMCCDAMIIGLLIAENPLLKTICLKGNHFHTTEGETWIVLGLESNPTVKLDVSLWSAEQMFADGYKQLAAQKGLSASGATIEPQRLDSFIFKMFVVFGGLGYYLDLLSDIYVVYLMSSKREFYRKSWIIWASLLTTLPTCITILSGAWTRRGTEFKKIAKYIFSVLLQLYPILEIYDCIEKGIETTAYLDMKFLEGVYEATPQIVLQAYIMFVVSVQSGVVDLPILYSIIVSLFSVSSIISMLADRGRIRKVALLHVNDNPWCIQILAMILTTFGGGLRFFEVLRNPRSYVNLNWLTYSHYLVGLMYQFATLSTRVIALTWLLAVALEYKYVVFVTVFSFRSLIGFFWDPQWRRRSIPRNIFWSLCYCLLTSIWDVNYKFLHESKRAFYIINVVDTIESCVFIAYAGFLSKDSNMGQVTRVCTFSSVLCLKIFSWMLLFFWKNPVHFRNFHRSDDESRKQEKSNERRKTTHLEIVDHHRSSHIDDSGDVVDELFVPAAEKTTPMRKHSIFQYQNRGSIHQPSISSKFVSKNYDVSAVAPTSQGNSDESIHQKILQNRYRKQSLTQQRKLSKLADQRKSISEGFNNSGIKFGFVNGDNYDNNNNNNKRAIELSRMECQETNLYRSTDYVALSVVDERGDKNVSDVSIDGADHALNKRNIYSPVKHANDKKTKASNESHKTSKYVTPKSVLSVCKPKASNLELYTKQNDKNNIKAANQSEVLLSTSLFKFDDAFIDEKEEANYKSPRMKFMRQKQHSMESNASTYSIDVTYDIYSPQIVSSNLEGNLEVAPFDNDYDDVKMKGHTLASSSDTTGPQTAVNHNLANNSRCGSSTGSDDGDKEIDWMPNPSLPTSSPT